MSRLHPLGFRKTTLPLPFGFGIRLHRWTGQPGNDKHNHRMSFIGLSVRGRFADHRYVETAGSDYERHDCRDTGEGYELANPCPRGLRYVGSHVRRPLVPYLCRSWEVHAYSPLGEGPHVSVIITGRQRSDVTQVYREVAS